MSQKSSDLPDSSRIERRTRARFRLVFPVIFRWSDGTEHSAVGYCRNIGLGGMFVVTGDCPLVGTELEIDVVVPTFDAVPRETLFRHRGETVRTQGCEDLLGFAVAGNFEDDDLIHEHVTNGAFHKQ